MTSQMNILNCYINIVLTKCLFISFQRGEIRQETNMFQNAHQSEWENDVIELLTTENSEHSP